MARSDDGNVQITFTIPFEEIDSKRQEVALSMGQTITVPGFRKGKAPLANLLTHIPSDQLLEKTLSQILPKLVSDAITQHKIKPAIYPKFELVKALDNEPWQIRAITCEIPEFELGDYKKAIANIAKSSSIWTPEKGNKQENESKMTRELKEQEVIKALIESVKIDIPKILVEEEVNARLSQLLEKIEKLGLNLDTYLKSIGKTAESLRTEYETQASQTLSLDLILSKIAEKENIKVDEKQVDAAIQVSSADKELSDQLKSPEQRRYVEAILRKRAALDSLTALL